MAHETSKHSESEYAKDGELAKPASPRNVHGVAWVLVVVSTISSMFLFGLDQTITADVQPAIVRRFGSVLKLPWISVTLLLGASASNLFWGQVYSNYNAKWIFLFNFFVFELGSTLCAASPTIDVLIGGRALCGFGGTGMYNGVMTMLSVLTSEKERALYMSIPGLAWGSSTVLGPIIGGAFTVSAVGWRWGFYINLCVGAAVTPIYLFLVPSIDPRPDTPRWSMDRFKKIDWVGFVLLLAIFICLLMGINFGGLVFAWNSGSIIALFVVAGVLIICFWIQQIFALGTTKSTRCFPLAFLSHPIMMVNFFNETCAATSCFLPIYFIPLFFQLVRRNSALEAGVHLLPYMAFLVFTVISEGFIMSHVHTRFEPWFLAGGALVLVGSALMYTVGPDTSTARIYGYSILLGTGTGAYLQMPFAVAQALVPPASIPVAVSFVAFAQLAGPAVTLSIANTIFLNKALAAVLRALPDTSADEVQRILSGAADDYLNTLDPETRGRVNDAITSSMRNIYVLVIIAGALTLILSTGLTFSGLLAGRKAKGLSTPPDEQAPEQSEKAEE